MMRINEALVQTRLACSVDRYRQDLNREPSDKTIEQMREVIVANMLADGEVA